LELQLLGRKSFEELELFLEVLELSLEEVKSFQSLVVHSNLEHRPNRGQSWSDKERKSSSDKERKSLSEE